MSATIATNPVSVSRGWSLAERKRLAELGLIDDPAEALLRFTLPECEQLEEHGFLKGERYELIHGEIVNMPPPNELHNCGCALVFAALQIAFGSGYYVRNQSSLELGVDEVPIPDASVVPGQPRDYSTRPTSALLVVEVSDSTYVYDITEKAELYAATGIADYWILDLNARRLVVLRDPAPLPDGGVGYRTHLFRYANETINPLALPSAAVAVNDLLP